METLNLLDIAIIFLIIGAVLLLYVGMKLARNLRDDKLNNQYKL